MNVRQRPRGLFILPSVFTAGNIAAGYYAITQSLEGSALAPQHFNYAALAIGFAIPFDAIDGRIARMTNTTSDFGKELDSLADVITFGVAPSILAFSWGFRSLAVSGYPDIRQRLVQLGAFICFLFLICGAARLARFNISHTPVALNPGRPGRKYFVGMPIPASAGMIAAVVHFFSRPAAGSLVDLSLVDAACRADRVSDGQHLAVLERQRNKFIQSPSLPPADSARGLCLRAGRVFAGIVVDHGRLLYVLGNFFAGRLLLDPPPQTGRRGLASLLKREVCQRIIELRLSAPAPYAARN